MKYLLFFIAIASALLSCSSSQKSATTTQLPFANKVIAHRGAWKNTNLPENSIASLKAAIALGCGGSEFDVHLTSDEVLVVNHDDKFMGLDIETSTYSQLLEKTMANGEKIPTLEAYLKEGLKQKHTKLVLEIKKSTISKQRTIVLTDKVLHMVQQLNASPWIVYISFDYEACRHIRQKQPAMPVQYLDGNVAPAQLKADKLGLDYHFSVFEKNRDWLAQAKKLGVATNAWTVNDEKVMDTLLEQGIDFITTNEPELLLKKLGK
ncbi:MAG: glycerophosphodiester phosphodiesterase family protein [Niabella sp.]